MPEPTPHGTIRMWVDAAEAVAKVSGLAETVASVLHARALRSFAEGIRQYLVVRCASVDIADALLAKLRDRAGEWPADELVAPPGPRARLYKEARALADEVRREHGVPLPEDRVGLPWKMPHRGVPLVHADALRRLRVALAEDDAEVVELHHARELAPEEIAFVRGEAVEQVAARLAQGEKLAAEIFGPEPKSRIPGLHGALIDAYELAPPETTAQTEPEGDGFAQGTVIGGRYLVEKRVGAGAFGDVYRATDSEVAGHVVAVKILHQPSLSETAKATALRELRLIASVFHPSIVQFKDHGWFAGRLWFVMPWYEGETLEARIRRDPLTRKEARTIFEPLASALSTMHASGIRHQDIKPDNIFLARLEGGEAGDEVLPVLLDLGVAAKEAEMVLAGTPMYFAPEVAGQFAARGDRRKPTVAADVFALALSLRNALEPESSEEVPGAAIETFISWRAENRPPSPDAKDLRYLGPRFERWLSLDPEKRPTAPELLRELAVLTQPEERRERTMRTLRWLVPLVAVLLTVFGTVVYSVRKNAEVAALRQRRALESVRANLAIQQAKNDALEEDNSALAREYTSSQMNRGQLAEALATKEAQIRHLGAQIDRALDREAAVRTELAGVQSQLDRTAATLASTRELLQASQARERTEADELTHEQQTLAERERTISDESQQIASLRDERDSLRVARDSLSTQVQTLNGQVRGLEARSGELAQQLAQAQQDRDGLRGQVDDLRVQLAQLRAQAQQQQQPSQGPAPAPPP